MTSTLRNLRTQSIVPESAETNSTPSDIVEKPAPVFEEILEFDGVYAEYFHDVMRWIRAMGGREPDLEDLAQEVFMIVGRKLATFDGKNLRGFLYRITQRTVRDYRRAAWFRNIFGGRKAVDSEPALLRLVEPGTGPNEHMEHKEAARVMAMILDRMGVKHRTAFVLFEIEGFTGEEIAELEQVPLNTIWTRLHHARKDFAVIVKQLRNERRIG